MQQITQDVSTVYPHCSNETASTANRPNLPEEEIKVDMMVIARRRPMRWQRGKIEDIITKGKTNNAFVFSHIFQTEVSEWN